MVCTWRYRSFKDLNLNTPRSTLILVAMAGVIFAIWNWSQPMLVILASIYVGSGIAVRIGGLIRKHFPRPPASSPRAPNPEAQLG
jgi:CDP-diacylglycerol--serine O-phosphatidyltransferase